MSYEITRDGMLRFKDNIDSQMEQMLVLAEQIDKLGQDENLSCEHKLYLEKIVHSFEILAIKT
jgi:hypothetical protein